MFKRGPWCLSNSLVFRHHKSWDVEAGGRLQPISDLSRGFASLRTYIVVLLPKWLTKPSVSFPQCDEQSAVKDFLV